MCNARKREHFGNSLPRKAEPPELRLTDKDVRATALPGPIGVSGRAFATGLVNSKGHPDMDRIRLSEGLREAMIEAKRELASKLVLAAVDRGVGPDEIYTAILGPQLNEVHQLWLDDKISTFAKHMAVQIARALIHQLQPHLFSHEKVNRKIVVAGNPGRYHELEALMLANLFEAAGWDVYFIGDPVNDEDLIQLAGTIQPDILLVSATEGNQLPDIRRALDHLRDHGSCPQTTTMVGGGVFNRAEGLWEEIGADLWFTTADQALRVAQSGVNDPSPKEEHESPRRRRRRKSTQLQPKKTNLQSGNNAA